MEDYVRQRDKVLDYIDENLNRNMTLDELAAVSCYSKFHFSRIFQSMMGETVFQYIHRLRLERAAKWIRIEEETPITNVAYELGFSNCANFSRSFKEHFGRSPSSWRLEQKEKNARNIRKLNIRIEAGNDNERTIFFNDRNRCWQYEVDKNIRLTVQIQEARDISIVYMRYIGASLGRHERFELAYETLMQWAVERGAADDLRNGIYAVYHDNPLITGDERIRISAGFEAPEGTEPSGIVGKMTLPGGKYAVTRFEYETKEEYISVYNFMYGYWLSRFGYIPDINRFDYLCFMNRPSEKILRTTLSIPIRVR